jgi:hypothetical protein|tara:strand:+ start:368 stop:673 length:306 start_codon:yes stop_codon:yes gene_type:complete
MKQVLDTKFSVYSEVKVVGMAQIVKDGDDFRTYLELRYPPEEEYRRYKGSFHSNIDDAVKWCRQELEQDNLKHIYEREQIVEKAMAEFYSQENRSKYDYNE